MEFMASVRLNQRLRLMPNTCQLIVLDTPPLLHTPTTDMASHLPMDMVSVTMDTPDSDMASVRLKLSLRLMPNICQLIVLDTPPPFPTPTMAMGSPPLTDMVSVTTDTPDLDMASVRPKLSPTLPMAHTLMDTTQGPMLAMDMETQPTPPTDMDITDKLYLPIKTLTLSIQALCIKLLLKMFSVLKWRNSHYLGKL